MNRSKNTKRFNFRAVTNDSSHQAGANTVTISVKDYDIDGVKGYSTPTGTVSPGSMVTMTVKEAKAFQNFLNKAFPSDS
jgi:hypothetical protein